MDNMGFIGFGSMGSMLIKGVLKSGRLSPEQIIVTRKDKGRLAEIKDIWPNINIALEAVEVVKRAKYVFICVKPLEYKDVLNEIKPHILPEQHIISLAGTVAIESIEKMADCKITKVMPTIISEVNEGIILICHNGRVGGEDARFIESLLSDISKIRRIDEKDFGFAARLTSCGPGLLAAVLREFAGAGLRRTGSFVKEDVEEMVLQTLYGTARLMLERNMGFDDVISRVATKGGITEEGVRTIKKSLPQVFDEMFDQTLNKRKAVIEKVRREFENACGSGHEDARPAVL
jgi:pyrroline-5-carboxylate reductase